jgi:hypothetical protein
MKSQSASPIPDTRTKKKFPDTPRANKGLTLKGLMSKTPAYVRNKARDEVVIRKLTKTWTKGGLRAVTSTALSMTKRDPTPHKCSIIGRDEKFGGKIKKSQIPALIKQKRVLVDCSCEFFKYYCEYALWAHGAARIRHSNGEKPVITNPSLVPLLCKHLYELAKTVKEHDL